MVYDYWIEQASTITIKPTRLIEASRICTAKNLQNRERQKALDLLIENVLKRASEQAATHLLGVMHPVIMRSLLAPRGVPFSVATQWMVDQQRCIIGLINTNDALGKFKPIFEDM
ncbi:hypothetical protein [Polycladidibacter stylochi]|uniref:hypothetical protein n=1 Tax=Polycladidibacter stylochi TaxID=1807766 RepID=UPI00082DA1DE|nr:hypothetical protein [Pseudovibrio stylochi]